MTPSSDAVRSAARELADEATFTRAMLDRYMAQEIKDDDMAAQSERLGLAAGAVRAALAALAALAATGDAGAVTAPVDAVGWGIVTADGRLSDWHTYLDRAKADRDCVDANLYGKRGPYRVVALFTRPEPT